MYPLFPGGIHLSHVSIFTGGSQRTLYEGLFMISNECLIDTVYMPLLIHTVYQLCSLQ